MKMKKKNRVFSLLMALIFVLGLTFMAAAESAPTQSLATQPLTVQDLPLALARRLEATDYSMQVIERNSLYEIETRAADGSGCIETFALPIKYIDANGDVQYIDTGMQSIGTLKRLVSKYDYQNAANEFTVQYSKNVAIGLDFNEAFTTAVYAPNKAARDGYITTDADGNGKIIYPSAFGEYTYLEYINGTNGIKENIVLYTNIGQNTFTFILRTDGLIAELINGGEAVQLREPNQQQASYFISPLYVYDATVALGQTDNSTFQHSTVNCSYRLESRGNNEYLLTYVIDEQWLNSPEIVWPVTIDPSISTTVADSNITDTYVVEGNPSAVYYGYNIMSVGERSGSSYGTMYAYVKFGTLPTLAPGYMFMSADFEMTARGSQNTGDRGACYRVTSEKSINSISWNNQPTSDTVALSYSHVKTAPFPNDTGYLCTGYVFDVTDAYNLWRNQPSKNYGLKIAYADATVADYNTFYSSEASTASNAPKLTVHYLPAQFVNGFNSGKIYYIRNANNTSAYLHTTSNGNDVTQATYSGVANQQWKVKRYSDDWDELIPQSHLQQRLYVNAASTQGNNFNVDMRQSVSNEWQRFRIVEVAQGQYILRCKADARRVLALTASGSVEAQVYDAANALSKGQLWCFEAAGEAVGIQSGSVYYLENKETKTISETVDGITDEFDYTMFLAANGTGVLQKEEAYERDRQWKVTYVGDGYYTFENREAFKQAFTATYLSYNLMGNSVVLAANSALVQHWQILLNEDGTYRIINRYSETLCMALDTATTNTQVMLSMWNGEDSQKWIFEQELFDPDKIYSIVNATNGLALSVTTSAILNGEVVQNSPEGILSDLAVVGLQDKENFSSQLWRFERVSENVYKIYPLHTDTQMLSATTLHAVSATNENNIDIVCREWYVQKFNDGTYYIQKENSNGMPIGLDANAQTVVFSHFDAQWFITEFYDTLYFDGGYEGVTDLSEVYYTVDNGAINNADGLTLDLYRQAVECWNGISSNVHLQYIPPTQVEEYQTAGKKVLFSICTVPVNGNRSWRGSCIPNGLSLLFSDELLVELIDLDWQYVTLYIEVGNNIFWHGQDEEIATRILNVEKFCEILAHEVGHALKLSHATEYGEQSFAVLARSSYVSIMQTKGTVLNAYQNLQIVSQTITPIDKMALQAKWGD